MNTLEVDSVNLSFNGKKILSNIFLKCNDNEIVALIGRNGSGKSSLLKVIFGTLKAENQSVRINGQYCKSLFKKKQAVNYLPQDGFVPDYMCFNDLANVFSLNNSLDAILKINEIEKYRSTKFKHLSGGIKKLIEIASLLYVDAKFLLLDEPFSFLAPVLVEKLIPHLKSQSKQKGIILTDHQYKTVLSVCNRMYLLNAGSIKEIKEESQLKEFGYL